MAKSPVEQPEHVYHFKWTTAFACPKPTEACSGVVGGIPYSLQPLANAVGGAMQQVMDSGNTYYYTPCGTVSSQLPECKSNSPPDDTPAICQKDSRYETFFLWTTES